MSQWILKAKLQRFEKEEVFYIIPCMFVVILILFVTLEFASLRFYCIVNIEGPISTYHCGRSISLCEQPTAKTMTTWLSNIKILLDLASS